MAAELAVRTGAPQDLISDLIALDDELCHRLKSNAKGVQRSHEYNVTIAISAQGLRDRLYAYRKHENTFRILVLGDSYTFGWGVEQEETFPKVLERKLNAGITSLMYEVINGGTLGYGIAHQYLFLRKYGYRFTPDLVIMAIDLPYSIATTNRYFSLEGKQLRRNATPCIFSRSRAFTRYIPFASYLRGHSHLFRYAGVTLLSLYSQWTEKEPARSAGEEQTAQHDLQMTKEILRMLRDEVATRGVKFAVVILPKLVSLHGQMWEAMEEFLSREGIIHLSLQESFAHHAHASALLFASGHRFNARGHRFMAQALEEFLQERGLLIP
jgi:hypothetical protein